MHQRNDNEMISSETMSPAESDLRGAYERPRLRDLGDVAELTRSAGVTSGSDGPYS